MYDNIYKIEIYILSYTIYLYKEHKLAISEDININEIKEEDMKDVKILTEKNL